MSILDEIRSCKAIDEQGLKENIVRDVMPSSRIFTVRITADIDALTDKSKKVNAEFKFEYPNGAVVTADGNIKLQGSGSIRWWPHCNYTINKLSTGLNITTYDCDDYTPSLYPMARTRNWGLRKKFVLKADHMDHTHGRNVIGARLWGDIVRTRSHKLVPVTSKPDDWEENYNAYYRFSSTSQDYKQNNSNAFLPVYNYYTTEDNGQEPIDNRYFPLIKEPADWDSNYTSYYFSDLTRGIVPNTHEVFQVYTYLKTDAQSPLDKLLALPNCGAVDGFPCRVFINGEYAGLYDFNIPKDENMFGMEDGTSEAILCGEDWVAATKFAVASLHRNVFEFDNGDLALISEDDYQAYTRDGTTPGKAWVIEYDEDDCSWIPEDFQNVLSIVYDYETYPNGPAFRDAFEAVFDEKSAIDYLIFIRALGLQDNYARNMILGKYTGGKWFCSAYDMDTAFGIYWTGSAFYSVSLYSSFDSNIYTNNTMRLWKRILDNYRDEIKKRYAELRRGALSNVNVIDKIVGFCKEIPDTLMAYQGSLYDKQYYSTRWPVLPGTGASNMFQLIVWYQEHAKILDEQVDAY